ncbi:glutamate formimidoyltransferase [Mucilaginibacter segetis]|uniref:glutamate formimidoyltransferase n=1 Tax=Mucilaginibacter segetis TaxID=2793071 RepID=A0A934PWL4_9SPHI|nr:glutamate formimidoyltransferase [Mucilaginibacter segetis]MBK0380426.1 glutamate formimidoyltransferase [Mucilaginibacter segetis]
MTNKLQIIECVPNFSEGVDTAVIKQIAAEIRSVKGVMLLNVDPGKATNRTVMTFAGSPEAVVDAAFLAIRKAGELIDMSRQKGEHPRMGSTDVCPLIPVSNISMQEVVVYADELAKRVGGLGIPVYLYEHSQPDKKRNNLSVIRAGEYEGFFDKIKQPGWAPDYGPAEFDAKRGATVIGARDFLIAYNVNLNTRSVPAASAIAAEVRESGRMLRTKDGSAKIVHGSLKYVKAIGWYIEEYGHAQVSMNLTNIIETPIHIVFEEICKKAQQRGLKVTGSELIGLIPLDAMLNAGRYFSTRQNGNTGLSETELIAVAVRAMGLDELVPFDAGKRIMEYVLSANMPL